MLLPHEGGGRVGALPLPLMGTGWGCIYFPEVCIYPADNNVKIEKIWGMGGNNWSVGRFFVNLRVIRAVYVGRLTTNC